VVSQGEDAEDAPNARRAIVLMDRLAHDVDGRASRRGARQRRQDAPRRPRGPIGLLDANPAARRADVLAQQLAGLRIDVCKMLGGQRDKLLYHPRTACPRCDWTGWICENFARSRDSDA